MKLENYVGTDKAVNGVKFTAKIIQAKGKPNVRTLQKLQAINYIVVHNTGNTSPTAGDEAHANYLQNVENADNLYVSWHITVDNDSATQHLPFNEKGFHAGDGNGKGNSQGIGIEIAENKDYPTSEANAIKVICDLMKTFNISIERVLPHRYFASNKKLCPRRILKNQTAWQRNWKTFQEKIMQEYQSLYGGEIKEKNQQAQMAIGSMVKIKKNAVYGGLSATRDKKIPEIQTGKKHTIVAFANHRGQQEAKLKEINSWVAIKNLYF